MTNIAVQETKTFDLSPQTFEQALTFANYLADSDLVPKDYKSKPANCLIAMQWGNEIGLKPLQALQNLAVINGRPALWGDAVIALVRSSPLCEYVQESDDGHAATCKVKRRGEPEQVRTFSMDDAKAAGLAGKQGPWTQYPKRMRQMRARAFALRDVFPDVLRGLPVAEEIMDTPKDMGPAQEVGAQQSAPAAYPEADFAANLPKWAQVVATGRKSIEDLIAMISSKAELTGDQQQRLRDAVAAAGPTDVQPKQAAPELDPFVVENEICSAESVEQIDAASKGIERVADKAERERLISMYRDMRQMLVDQQQG